MTIISLIVAVADNNVIGRNNDLIWHMPDDLKRFKSVTMGKPVIMGRKTFESIHARLKKPLPNRMNIIISQTLSPTGRGRGEGDKNSFEMIPLPPSPETLSVSPSPHGERVYLASSLTEAIKVFDHTHQEIFIIGGAQIYAQALAENIVDKIYLTRVHQSPKGDAFFPVLDKARWKETSIEKHDGYDFIILKAI
jgi:dihydrofolate reductase